MTTGRNLLGQPRAPRPLTALPPGSPRGRKAEYILAAEQLAELRALTATTTRSMARLAGLIVNDVLEVSSGVFDASGIIQRQWHVAAGCVVVENIGTHLVWVFDGSAHGAAVVAGPGMTPIPAGTRRVVNAASRVITFFGTAGDTIGWQVLTRGGVVGSDALGAVDGGTP